MKEILARLETKVLIHTLILVFLAVYFSYSVFLNFRLAVELVISNDTADFLSLLQSPVLTSTWLGRAVHSFLNDFYIGYPRFVLSLIQSFRYIDFIVLIFTILLCGLYPCAKSVSSSLMKAKGHIINLHVAHLFSYSVYIWLVVIASSSQSPATAYDYLNKVGDAMFFFNAVRSVFLYFIIGNLIKHIIWSFNNEMKVAE